MVAQQGKRPLGHEDSWGNYKREVEIIEKEKRSIASHTSQMTMTMASRSERGSEVAIALFLACYGQR